MNFKDMLDKLSMLSEATKETPTGRVHKAEPGGYGRKYDTDEEGEEQGGDKDAKKPAEKRGRGRPAKSGAHVSSPAEKKKQKEKEEAGKALQSMIGKAPKKSKELEKLPSKKHSLKEFFEQIDEERMLKEAEQITMEPAKQSTQIIKKGNEVIGSVNNPALAQNIKAAIGRGEMSLAGKEMSETALGEKWAGDAKIHATGEYSKKSVEELKSMLAKLKKTGPHPEGSPAAKKQQQINFALRAKGGWKKGEGAAMKEQDLAEVERPTGDNMSAMGAGLGAGRSDKMLEAKKAVKKDDKAEKAGKKVAKDIEYDEKVKDKIHGKKRHAEDEKAEKAGKKVAKDIEYDEKKKKHVKEAAKPDFPDIDDDGNKKESIKKAAQDAKKKKLKENAHRHSSARLMGKAHALAKEAYNCKYEDMEEAKMYHEGYKEGLDECYGLMPIRGVVVGEAPAATVPGMASQAMPKMEADLDEMDKGEWMRHKAQTTPGDTFKAFGQTMHDKDVLENEFAFESLDKQLNDLLIEGEKVEEGMSVSISKGQQGAPDSVTVSAQDSEAEKLLSFIKQTGLGIFGDEGRSDYGSPISAEPKHTHGDIEVVDDHDGMMSLMKKMSGIDQGGEDYRDEEHHDDHDSHDEHCDTCGEAQCQCDEEMVDEVQNYDQEEFEVSEGDKEDANEGWNDRLRDPDDYMGHIDRLRDLADVIRKKEKEEPQQPKPDSPDDSKRGMQEDNPPDSEQAEHTADEDAEAAEDAALAKSDQQDKTTTVNEGGDGMEDEEQDVTESIKLDEWANDAGKRGTETTFVTDEQFMIDTISSGLNKRKVTGQTTIPVIAGQNNRMGDDSLVSWKKLAGITK